jgi:hypothetical protein
MERMKHKMKNSCSFSSAAKRKHKIQNEKQSGERLEKRRQAAGRTGKTP